jgi:hypothetical protein
MAAVDLVRLAPLMDRTGGRPDVTEGFPFLAAKLSPHFDR